MKLLGLQRLEHYYIILRVEHGSKLKTMIKVIAALLAFFGILGSFGLLSGETSLLLAGLTALYGYVSWSSAELERKKIRAHMFAKFVRKEKIGVEIRNLFGTSAIIKEVYWIQIPLGGKKQGVEIPGKITRETLESVVSLGSKKVLRVPTEDCIGFVIVYLNLITEEIEVDGYFIAGQIFPHRVYYTIFPAKSFELKKDFVTKGILRLLEKWCEYRKCSLSKKEKDDIKKQLEERGLFRDDCRSNYITFVLTSLNS